MIISGSTVFVLMFAVPIAVILIFWLTRHLKANHALKKGNIAAELRVKNDQLRIAQKALTDEASTGSLNAQVALEDIQRLREEHDQDRLELGRY